MALIQANQIMQDDPSGARLPHNDRYDHGSAFANGKFCAASEAMVPLYDMGFIQGDAVYEKATIVRGRYFRLQDHFDRFARSCKMFYLRSPYTPDEMTQIFDQLLSLTGLKEAGVWWGVTRGLQKSASDRGNPDAFENRFYAAAGPYGSIATEAQRNRGLDIMIGQKHIRVPSRAIDPTVKNTNWMDMKLSLFEAREQGKDFSVLTDSDGYLTEAPGANVFLVSNGELYTPEAECLRGITRLTVLELAEMAGIRTHVTRVHAEQLRKADDAFLTSSAGGIMPISSVDGALLRGGGGAGEIVTRLHNLYWEKLFEGWKCTPVSYSKAD